MVEIQISGINLRTVKIFQEQDFCSKDKMEINVLPRKAVIKDPSQPNRVTLNDSGLYEASVFIYEAGKDFCYDLFVAWLLQMILEGNISSVFKIGKKSVLEELEQEYRKRQLENLCEEESVKAIELKLKKILLEEQVRKIEESQK